MAVVYVPIGQIQLRNVDTSFTETSPAENDFFKPYGQKYTIKVKFLSDVGLEIKKKLKKKN